LKRPAVTITEEIDPQAPPIPPKKQQAPLNAEDSVASRQVASDPNAKEREGRATDPLHPFANIPENNYQPPNDKVFAAKPPQNKDATYRTVAPIQNPRIVNEVYSRSMTTPYITLTSEELLSLAPDVRQKMRDAITPKRVSINSLTTSAALLTKTQPETEEVEEIISEASATIIQAYNSAPPPGSFVIQDPIETYLKTLSRGDNIVPTIVAKDSHALRSIFLVVNEREKVECIVDGGCQIIAMSEAVCHNLGLIYDPRIILQMESANGEIDPSLGLARNVPCQIGSVTLYLQIHVIREPAYDILLGRPFDVLTQSLVKNFSDENQTITIHDPNSHETACIPTFPRGQPRHRLPSRPEKRRQKTEREPSRDTPDPTETESDFHHSRN
jgi:hypothetical protein